jgi:hypothetical protein
VSHAENLADTPATWADPSPISTLHALLVFVGIPLLIVAVITLLVMAPSLAKGPRYRPSQQWDADAEWFGFPEAGAGAAGPRQLESSRSGAVSGPRDETGGASARW